MTFFVTKKKAEAEILFIEGPDGKKTDKITLKYFNSYLHNHVTCQKKIPNNYKGFSETDKLQLAEIYYGKFFPRNVYFVNLSSPTFLIVFFDGFMIIIMAGCFFAFKSKLTRILKQKD